MKKLSLPLVLDVLFYSASLGFIALGILRYFRVPLLLALAVSALLFLAAGGALALFLYERRKKRQLGKQETEERDALMLHLALEREERVRAALLAAYAADGKEAHCEEEALIADGVLTVPFFTMQPVSADDAARLLRRYGSRTFTLVCNELSPEAEKLLRSFGRNVVRGDEVYRLFSRTETMPKPFICGDIPRVSVKQKWRRTFSKSNARPFFVSGALLLVMSLFTLFPVYYLVTGSLLLVTSVFVRALGYA